MLPQAFGVSNQITADAAIGTEGAPTVIWSITLRGTTTATITIRNGTGTGDPAVWGPNVAYTPAATVPPLHITFPNGLWCGAGAFADTGGTTPLADVVYNTLTTG